MQAFLAAWLDQLSWTDSLRLGAACSSAREALGADGVAAAAFAATRPWRAEPEGSLRLWRRAWDACASASSALGLHGGAWLKTGTVIPAISSVANSGNPAVTLDLACARKVAEHHHKLWWRNRQNREQSPHQEHSLIAILLISGDQAIISGQHALFLDEDRWTGEECLVKYHAKICMELKMLFLLSSPLPLARPVFAAAIAFTPELMERAV